jgi:tripartite ATP-independent transporter DctM subunit
VIALTGTLLLLLLFALGAPLFAVLLGATLLGFSQEEIDLTVIGVELYRIVDTPLLLALPMFTFTGYVLAESNTSQRLLAVMRALFGWMPDGLALVAVLACTLFTAFTGASGVTIVALGALLLPALRNAGYGEKFNLGLITSSGSLGLLLPPSLPLILYGIILQQMNLGAEFSFEDLFLAGLLPSLLMIGLLAAWILWSHRGRRIPLTPFSAREALAALRAAAWELPLPLFVLGGIFGGFFALSEVAAVAALYALVTQMLIYREITVRKLIHLTRDCMVMVGGILLILAVAMAFTNFLIDAEVPTRLFEWIKAHIDSKWTFLLLLNLFLLLLGAFLDVFSALVIVAPLIVPVAMGFGIHPVHLGMIFLANMQIGYFTPPVGMNLFIAAYRFNRPIVELYHATVPFMAVLLVAVAIITYWPGLSLMLIQD